MQLEQSDEVDKGEEEIPITRQHSVHNPTSQTTDLKGKNIETSPEKTKKAKEVQPNQVVEKKRKLLSVASSPAKKAKVYFEHLAILRE